jgi:hypothetical protein
VLLWGIISSFLFVVGICNRTFNYLSGIATSEAAKKTFFRILTPVTELAAPRLMQLGEASSDCPDTSVPTVILRNEKTLDHAHRRSHREALPCSIGKPKIEYA